MSMKKIMLFSGGFDCLIQSHFIKPDIYLYVDMRSTYSEIEKKHLKLLPKHIQDKLIISPLIGIGTYEKPVSLYIPFRNLYLLLTALQYGQIVYMGFNEADNAPDKTNEFNKTTKKYLKSLCGINYRPDAWKGSYFDVRSPYKNVTKSELLKKYIKNGGDLSILKNLRTCYDSKSIKGCGNCIPCLNKAVAYINNGLPLDFDKKITYKRLEKYVQNHKYWRPNSKLIKEYHVAIRRLKGL